MVPYQSYQLSQAGRPMSRAEQQMADARTGELAAALSRPMIAVSARIRGALRWQSLGYVARSAGAPSARAGREQADVESAVAVRCGASV